jgi:DNA-directed RNA polymerase subunit RPC12/RpoP
MRCRKCGTGQLVRTKRHGWVEKQVYTRLGMYPWLCKGCKTRVMLKVKEETNEEPLPVWVE